MPAYIEYQSQAAAEAALAADPNAAGMAIFRKKETEYAMIGRAVVAERWLNLWTYGVTPPAADSGLLSKTSYAPADSTLTNEVLPGAPAGDPARAAITAQREAMIAADNSQAGIAKAMAYEASALSKLNEDARKQTVGYMLTEPFRDAARSVTGKLSPFVGEAARVVKIVVSGIRG